MNTNQTTAIRGSLARIKRRIIAQLNAGTRFMCTVCGGRFARFLPQYEHFSILGKVVWDGYHPNAVCPNCHSLPRHRFLMEALHTQTPFLTTQSDVLHLAPEESIEKNLRKLHGSRYVTGDLEPWTKTMKKVDVTEIPFESASFDLVLCSHVLEHVVDDGKAMKEIFRILRPGGMAIVAVPIFVPKTYEDATVDSREQRGQMFGSETHVRLYGSDIVGRLHGAGFDTEILNEDQVEGKFVDRAVKDAARESEKLLFLCRKPGAPGR